MNALFRNVLTASFHGSIVILAVLLLRLILRKAAPKKYLCYLWVLAGLRLLMPFDIQSQFSLQPQTPPGVIVRWEQPASFYPSEEPEKQPRQTLTDITDPHPDGTYEDLPVSNRALPEEPEARVSLSGQKAISIPLLPLLWAAVAMAFFGYNIYCYQSLRKKVGNARKIPGGWESDGIETAFILGFIKPRIYIPTQTPQQDRGYILAHERTHLEKGDHWIKMLGFATLAIHWFNPLVWVAYILLCKDIEMACDERVVQFMELQERKEYSTALLNCSSSQVRHAASPVAFGEVNVKNRIQSILAYRNPSFWAGFLSAMAVVFVTVCFVTNPIASGDGLGKITTKAFTLATQPPMVENPDWGLTIRTDLTSTETMRLYYRLGSEDQPWDGVPLEIIQNAPYDLETWNGKAWEAVPLREDAPDFYSRYDGSIPLDDTYYTSDTVELRAFYGKLPEGDYRLCIPVSRLEETQIHYVWFHIYANALTGDEAEAFARVETALYRLTDSQSYMATISDSSRQGVVLPTATIRLSGSSAQIDYYTGEYCYASYPCASTDSLVTAWMDSFYPGENSYISFAGKDGKISDNEICFTSSWVDVEGQVYHKTHTYLLNDLGQLTGATLLTQSTDDDGVITKSQRTLSVEYDGKYVFDSILTPKDAATAEKESPWNLYFTVDSEQLTASGGQVCFRLGEDHIGVSSYSTDAAYWLEKYSPSSYEEKRWQPLLTKSDNASWGDDTYRVKSRSTTVDVDWTPYYGVLSPGMYRMGKHFYHGSETITQYAEFLVYPSGAILGSGGDAAMARVNAAIEKACAGNYCIKSTNYSTDPLTSEQVDYIYWKWNGICVTDCAAYGLTDFVRRAPVREGDDEYVDPYNNFNPDTFYDRWAKRLSWNTPNFRIYFPQGDSVISDEEISFTGAFFRNAHTLAHYSVFFDEAGNLTSIVIQIGSAPSTILTNVLSFENVPEAEIKAVVEEALAKEAQSEGGSM